jgi:LuxR family maltose regulon positive regulatory protein
LERALTLAESEGYMRTFLDEGKPLRLLLAEYHSNLRKKSTDDIDHYTLGLLAYIEKLLAAFSQPISFATQAPGNAAEALRERELEVLRLISIGLTNQEIAQSFVIAVSTVKSHINSLYAKLGMQRRTQAIVIAKELGFLPD